MMEKKLKGLALFLLFLGVLFYTGYKVAPDSPIGDLLLYLAGITTLWFGIVTGLVAVIFSLFNVLLAFIATLPFFSAVSAWMIAVYAVLYRWVFGALLRKTIGRLPQYQRFNHKVAQSQKTIRFKNWLDQNMTKFGFQHPKQYKVLEVERCPYCRSWMPTGSRYCPGCGENSIH